MLCRTPHGDAACFIIVCLYGVVVGVVLLRDLKTCKRSFSLFSDLHQDFLSLAWPLTDLLNFFSVLIPRIERVAREVIAAQELRICFAWHLALPRASGDHEPF